MNKYVAYSNEYTWRIFMLSLFLSLFIIGMDGMGWYFTGDWSLSHIVRDIIFTILIFLLPSIAFCRNKYVIVNDSLHIEEYTYIYRTLSADVMLSHIRSAEIRWSWTYLRKVVRVYTTNDQFDLLCTTHREDLVEKLNELCNHNSEQQ